ncbi:hypothetical protein Tco_1576148 [Tanacetum coccineum]
MKEDEADDAILLPALDNGAFITVKRKLTNDFVINARQHLIRERIQKFRNFRVSVKSETKEVESTNPSYRKTKVFSQRKKVGKYYGNRNSDVELLENERVSITRSVNTKKSKCRHGWQFAQKRGTPSSSSSDKMSSNYSQDIVKFGRMPPVTTHVGNPEDLVTQTDHATYTKSKGKLDVNLKNNNSFGDSSFINYFGLGNIEPIYPRPSTQYGSVDHNFPPKQASDDLFDFLNGTKGDETFSGTQLHPIELNDNYKLEQVSQDDGQELPNEVS